MEGDKQARQWISALMDSELAHLTATQIDALHHSEEQKNTWSIYHQIGDILRFEHQALSHDFQVKLSHQLAQQPEYELPQQKYAELASLASKKIVKSSLSLLEKKARDDAPNNSSNNSTNKPPHNSPNNSPATKAYSLHTPVHLAQ